MANMIKMTFEDALKGIERVNNMELVGNLGALNPAGVVGVHEFPFYLVAYGTLTEKEDSSIRTFAPNQLIFLNTMDEVLSELRNGLVGSVQPYLFLYDEIEQGYAFQSFIKAQYSVFDEKKGAGNRYFKGTDYPIELVEGVEFSRCPDDAFKDLKGNELIVIPNFYDVITFNYVNKPDGFLNPQNLYDVKYAPNINSLIDFAVWDLYLGYTDKVVINNGVYTVTVVADADDFDKYILSYPKRGREEFDIFKDFVNIKVSPTFILQDKVGGILDDFDEVEDLVDTLPSDEEMAQGEYKDVLAALNTNALD